MTDRPRIPGRRFLHSPGPTPVPDEVLHAMSRQPMDMGDPRVDAVIAACDQGLKRLLRTEAADVFFYAANGHGVWEAVVENLLPPGGVALVPGTGHFSESWAVQTEALGRRVVRTPWHEGLPIDPAAVTQALREDREREIAAVFVVHTDTSSGITSDLPALRAAIDAADHPALFVVDVVASLGAEPFDMDTLRADVALGASQKGLMCPPGVGFVAVGAAAFEAARRSPAPRFYWDFVLRKSDLSYRKFCGTPPQNLMAGLEAALALLHREGLDAEYRLGYARRRRRAELRRDVTDPRQEIDFELRGDFIALDALLKATGLAASGGLAKAVVAEGQVQVDGRTELRKTCKIRAGQVVAVAGVHIRMLAGPAP